MLFVRNFLQLQPVNGQPVFDLVSKKQLFLKLGCSTSLNIWKDCMGYDELTINESRKNDVKFSSMLD